MGWEKRGGGLYYYSAKKIAGRVVKRYVGAGGLSGFVSAMEQAGSLAIQAQRITNRIADRKLREESAQVQQFMDVESRHLLGLAFLCLRAEGYHRPKCGPWRKRWTGLAQQEREMMSSLTIPDTFEERLRIVNKAIGNSKDEAAQSLAVACMKAHPHEVIPTKDRMFEAVLQRTTHGNDASYEMNRQAAVKLWQELAGRDKELVPAAERLLIDRVVACHYWLLHVERVLAMDMPNPKQRAYYENAQDRAHKQYLAALKTLAQVRRLNLPMVIAVNAPSASQVNVGSQQVNSV